MHEIIWTRRAKNNLEEIGAYIASDNPSAAAQVVRRIVERVAVLAFFPTSGRIGSVAGTRELVVADTPYIVIYRHTQRIEILRIRHGAQRWP